MSDLKGLISIARKAGYVVIGLDNLKVYTQKLYLIVIDETSGKGLRREANFLAEKRNVTLAIVKNVDDYIGIENCKIIGIKNKNFSEMILKAIDEIAEKGE